MAIPQHGWTTREWIACHIQEVALDYVDNPPCVSAIPSYCARQWSDCTMATGNSSLCTCTGQTAAFSSRAENVAVGCRASSSGSRLWFALLPHQCYSILTSRGVAAAWNQASILRSPQLPAVQDPERVDPSDTFLPACCSQ